MIARQWSTKFKIKFKSELVRFANEVSKPFISSQPGNQGVLFFSEQDNWVTLTLWDNLASISKMEKNPVYIEIVNQIYKLNALTGESTTKVFEVH